MTVGNKISPAVATGGHQSSLVTEGAPRGGAGVTKALICPMCGLPWAFLRNDRIVVESKHKGAKHLNSISVWDLLAMVLS